MSIALGGQVSPGYSSSQLDALHIRARAVAAICAEDPNSMEPTVVGTATLLALGVQPVIVTAAHVAHHLFKSELLLAVGDGLPMERLGRSWAATDGGLRSTRSPDSYVVDVAVHFAPLELMDRLGPDRFTPVSDIEAGPRGPLSPLAMIGFPVSRSKGRGVRPNSRRIGRLNVVSLGVYDERLEKLHINSSKHFALEFDRRDFADAATGESLEAPLPHGLSGGPIWSLDAGQISLIGIGIEYREHDALVVATRMGVVADVMLNYSDTACHVSRS